jgi:hypothetical protein
LETGLSVKSTVKRIKGGKGAAGIGLRIGDGRRGFRLPCRWALASLLAFSFAGCTEAPDVAVSVFKPEDRLLPPDASREAGVE